MSNVTLQFAQSASGDDGYWNSVGVFKNGANELYVADHQGVHHSFMTFKGVVIPKGAIITSATITLYTPGFFGDEVTDVYLEDTTVPSTLTNAAEANAMSLTPAVRWEYASGSGGFRTTSSIHTLLQGIVDKSGWDIGCDIRAVIKYVSGPGKPYFWSYEKGAGLYPVLKVTWTLPANWILKNSGVGGDDWSVSSAGTFASNGTSVVLWDSYRTGFRFPNVAIGNKNAVKHAYLILTCKEVMGGWPFHAKLALNDEDAAVAPADGAGALAKTVTAYTGGWDTGFEAAERLYHSPDFASSLQKVVNRAGWASGNALMVISEDDGTRNGTSVYAYDNGSKVPLLLVEYDPNVPNIAGISPDTGAAADEITISGVNFSATASENTVKFNGVSAVVISATTTEIVATVPVGCGDGEITVETVDGTGTSETFTYSNSSTPPDDWTAVNSGLYRRSVAEGTIAIYKDSTALPGLRQAITVEIGAANKVTASGKSWHTADTARMKVGTTEGGDELGSVTFGTTLEAKTIAWTATTATVYVTIESNSSDDIAYFDYVAAYKLAGTMWLDSTGAGLGRFSSAPGGTVAYCNGVDSCIWGGDEAEIGAFINFDPNGTFSYDYTDAVRDESDEVATLEVVGNGLDANAVLMLHLDNNVTDDSPTTPHTVTNTDMTYSTTEKVFGTHGGVFNGTTAFLSVPDDADFDFSDGTFTVDTRAKFTDFAAIRPLYYQATALTKISFTTGTVEPAVGATINGQTSSATGIVDYVDVTSGTWGAGDAAGTLYMHTVTGTWQNAENIRVGADVKAITSSTASSAGSNFIKIFVDTSAQLNIQVYECYGAGADVVRVTSTFTLSTATWYHLEFSESASNWYIFSDGDLKITASDASRAKNYTGAVLIGSDGTAFMKGYLDEYRASQNCRHTASFTPLTEAYSAATNVAHVYIGTIRPAEAFKFYLDTANTATAVATGFEWDGSWSELTLTDGTILTAGKTLTQDGSISFASTVATAKVKYIDGNLLYFYWFKFTGISAGTKIKTVTMNAPFQAIVDKWDGIERTVAAFYKYITSYADYTVNVYDDEYSTSYADTYAELDTLPASSGDDNCVILGFFERMTAVTLYVPSDRVNITANTTLSVDYWDGEQYTTVGSITDGTAEGGISLSKPGTVSWDAPTASLVFKKTLANTNVPLYYYRLRWNQILSGAAVYHATGIPAQRDISGYKFPLHSQDSLMLCADMTGKRNSIIVSATETAQIFNGTNSGEIEFGDSNELNCGCSVFSQYGSNLFSLTMLFKDSEQWNLVRGDTGLVKYRVSETIGCAAPLTLDTFIVPPLEGQQQQNRSYAIWEGPDGVYVSDGRHPSCVSHDIRDLWDQDADTHINQSYIGSHYGRVDQGRMEYHLFIATTTGTVTTLDDEWVLDLRRWKWYRSVRGTALQGAISVMDAYGSYHYYGFTETGYVERLDYGTTFDGADIDAEFQTGDIALGDPLVENRVLALVPVMKAKTTTTNDATFTLYTDTETSGDAYTVSPVMAGQRVTFPVETTNSVPGVCQSIKGEMSTDDETCGFEPIMIGIFHQPVREHNYE